MRRLSSYDLSLIACEHVRGRSDAAIGALLDPPRDRSTVRKARSRASGRELIRAERHRQSSAARSAAYRQRKKEQQEQAEKVERGYAPHPSDSLARGNQNRYPHISANGYLITSNVCYPRRATRADYPALPATTAHPTRRRSRLRARPRLPRTRPPRARPRAQRSENRAARHPAGHLSRIQPGFDHFRLLRSSLRG